MKTLKEELFEVAADMGLKIEEAVDLVLPVLKEEGLLPKQSREYTRNIVRNVFYGLSKDENILPVLKSIQYKRSGKKLSEVEMAEQKLKEARQEYFKVVSSVV
ncbi:hypothetical protein GCM10027347_52940 [Larkinella harenae]